MYIRKRKQKQGGQDVDGVELSELPDNKYLKDKAVTEAFDKQTQVKLNSEGINHGDTE